MDWSFKNFVNRTFTARFVKRAAAITLGTFVSYTAMMFSLNRTNSSVKLTSQEKQIAASFFGKDIDTNRLDKTENRALLVTDILNPKHLKENWSQAFGKKKKVKPAAIKSLYDSPDLYGRFFYQMAQQWQKQHGQFSPFARNNNDYTLTKQTKFDDLPQTHQAAVLEDYARSFLHWKYANVKHYTGKITTSFDSLLINVVENKFPAIKPIREAKGLLITENESRVIKSFFGESFNTRSIRKVFDKKKIAKAKDHTDEAPAYVSWDHERSNIYFNVNLPRFVATDYTQTNPFAFGTFMHEMTHIWQLRTNQPSDAVDRYSYVLKEDTKFSDLNNERQGALVRDYCLLFLYPKASYIPDFDQSKDKGEVSAYSRIAHVIERQFPDAYNARMAMGRQRCDVPVVIPDPQRNIFNWLPKLPSSLDKTLQEKRPAQMQTPSQKPLR